MPTFLPAWMTAPPYDKPVMMIVGPFLLLRVRGPVHDVKTDASNASDADPDRARGSRLRLTFTYAATIGNLRFER